jgi:hypothetical protein
MDACSSASERNAVETIVPSTLTDDCDTKPFPSISTITPVLSLLITAAEEITGSGERIDKAIEELSDGKVEIVYEIVTEPAVIGAVYMPPVVMVPTVAFPPAIPFTDQVKLSLWSPVIWAENVVESPARSWLGPSIERDGCNGALVDGEVKVA